MPTSSTRRRRLLAGLAPFVLAAAALPLLAPTCGSNDEGVKTFARRSLVIPMDRCYQSQTDGVTPAGTPANCPQTADAGDVIRAYGLVYQLIRNDVAVYWVINNTKTAADAEDFNIQYNGGFPAFLYDWNTAREGANVTQQNVVRYRGGPFVVDGSDFDKASAVLQQYRTQFSNVNVHVSNVAFQGYVKKTMAGGWSAGAGVPPKLALLDIGSGNLTSVSPPAINDPKNAEPVISGYLARAGIGSGAAAGTAVGPHGEIYDKLGIDDFQPAAGSTDWRTSRFGQNGYQILWIPHWLAAGSCSNFSSSANCASTLYSEARTDQVLKTIGAFVAAGGDIFAECAGIGSFEGAFTRNASQATTTYTTDYPAPCDASGTPGIETCTPTTRFQTTTGVRYSLNGNEVSYNAPIRVPDLTNFASPLLQLGDFTFKPVSGAIDVFRPNLTAPAPNTGAYQPGTVRLVAATGTTPLDLWDFFTLRPASGGRGTIVYLGGHSYSGVQGSFQIGGSRLVLNTLFNLGAGCTESGVACETGALGICGQGTLRCSGTPAVPTCVPVNQPTAEICNGLDDNCNGLVDEGLETSCYDGPGPTRGVGLCRDGIRQCVQAPDGSYGFTACLQQVLPGDEVCNALDDDCDGQVDESLQEACYQGPLDTVDQETGQPKGSCRPGARICTEGNWGSCVGQVLPRPETCTESGAGADDNCNGLIDEGCICIDGQTQPCYGGPAGTSGVGECRTGQRTCAGGTWSACGGQVTPATEQCTNPGETPKDENCDGQVDEGCGCRQGQTEACYTGPAGTQGVGLCTAGNRACVSGAFSGECVGDITPATADTCDGKDNDCDGLVDEGATCASGFQCNHGVCVPATCGSEQPCPEGYACGAGGPGCQREPGGCGGQTCPDGEACRFGGCSDPCEGVTCGQGAVCASGACVGGACYVTGCPAGELCLDGACQTDPCGALNCPSGTFCRQGFCVQACTFVTCRSGEICGEAGFCEPDLCAGKTCPAGELCVDGSCQDDACAGLGCGTGQVCEAGVCVDDPCAGVRCPAGACLGGQCYSTGTSTGVGGEDPGQDGGGCGCGAGGGVGPVGALLALLAVPLARRRRRGTGAALVIALAALAGATGCKEDEAAPFDPSKCAASCEGEERCIDHLTDPLHCGICGNACGDGNQCVDGVCGPSSAVAPRITGFNPTSLPIGGTEPVTLTVTGERFQAGAQLRALTPAGAILVPTDGATATPTQLRAEFNLLVASPTTWEVRVLNPDNVISNARGLDVVVPSPAITAVAPASMLAGETRDVTVTGTGLGLQSQCRIAGTGGTTLLETALPSVPGATGTLVCSVDARLLAPGSYQVWVVNQGSIASNRLAFALVSATPTISSLSPSVGEASTTVAMTVVGTGFDLTSQVLFDFDGTGPNPPAAVATTYFDPTLLYVSQLVLPPIVCGSASCTHDVRVSNSGSGGTSNTLPFRVGSAPPAVSGVSPGTGYQGETVTIVFQGSGFLPGTVAEAAPPSGVFFALPSTTPSCPGACTEVRGTLDLTDNPAGSRPEGSWLLRVKFPDGSTSAPFSFRVLSNQAILRDATPRGGAQGTSPVVTMTVGNLRTPYPQVRVLFDGQTLVPSSASGTTVTVTLSLVGKNTGTYALAVLNPSFAGPSNALSFNVTPGPPTLASVAPTSAARSDTPVTVTLTGTNFAKPDASGNGASSVHIFAPAAGVLDYVVPKADTTVVSPTQIQVRLDTRAGVPARYDVQVWNPGGANAPQKSNTLANAFEILP